MIEIQFRNEKKAAAIALAAVMTAGMARLRQYSRLVINGYDTDGFDGRVFHSFQGCSFKRFGSFRYRSFKCFRLFVHGCFERSHGTVTGSALPPSSRCTGMPQMHLRHFIQTFQSQ